MSNTHLIPFSSLSKEYQLKAIKLARLVKSLAINFDNDIQTTLPEFIDIIYQCTDCENEATNSFKSIDWIEISEIHFPVCDKDNCEGKLIPEGI
jgi:hypothetical protein